MPSHLTSTYETLPLMPSLLAHDLSGARRRSAWAALIERSFFLMLVALVTVLCASTVSNLRSLGESSPPQCAQRGSGPQPLC